jgi:hypothetical protein
VPSRYINDLDHWAQRAVEMRALADDVKDSEAKAMMVRIAADYERLAERALMKAGGQPVSNS